ncbi:MAG: hypothetical protein WCG02_04135 [Candidatus Taylorbacteria bacterium]
MNKENFVPNEKDIKLSTLDTSEIISHLDSYNKQFSLGASMARQLLHGLDREQRKGDKTFDSDTDISATEDQFAEQLVTFDQMKADMQELMSMTGLEYQPMQTNWFIAGSEGNHPGSEMRLNLKDGSQFVKYLQVINPESISQSQKDGLNQIVEVLCKQFVSYDLNDPNDERLLEFMGSISTILAEYRRIFGDDKLSEDIKRLEKYLSYARNGCLRELRAAEELSLDEPFTGQGFVLRWHTDATPEYLQKGWDSVIDTLHMISKNDKAVEIYRISKDTALHALDSAIGEVTSLADQSRDKKAFLSILNAIKVRMLEF